MLNIKIVTQLFALLLFVYVATSESQILKKINPDEGKILTLTFSNNGEFLAFGTTAGALTFKSIYVYKCDDWTKMSEFGGEGRDVTSIKFSPNDKYLATTHDFATTKISGGAGDKTVLLWDVYGNLKWNLGYTQYAHAVEFTKDSKYLILNRTKSKNVYWGKNYEWFGYTDAVYYDISTKQDKEFNLKKYYYKSTHSSKDPQNSEYFNFQPIKVSNDGKQLILKSYDSELLLWDLNRQDDNVYTLVTKNELFEPVMDISIDGTKAAVGNYSKDNWVYLWDLNSKLHTGSFKGHKNWVKCIAFSPDGNYLVTGSKDETIRIWDIKTKKTLKILKDHDDNVNAVAFSPDGKYLASAGDDGRIFIWDAGELMPELKIFSANYDLKYGLAKEFEEEKQKEIALLNDMFKPKGEFETTEEYNARITKANEDKKAIEDKYSQKLQEYMVSKQSELEKLNEEKKEADVEKQIELENKIESSVKDTIVNIASIGTYDADNNILPVTVKGKSGKISILRSEAQSLKENWKKTKAKSKMKLREDLKTYEYFDIIIIHPLTNSEYKLEY